jgi:shikimate dehydrogenase
VDVLNRTHTHAAELRARLDPIGRTVRVLNSIDASAGEEFDLVINATPLGLRDSDPLPLDLARVARAGAAIDMVYRPQGTAWAESAARLGIPASDGLEMLLYQGAAAFTLWWGRAAPLEAMRSALAARPT